MVWHNQCRNAIFQQKEEKIHLQSSQLQEESLVCLHLYEDSFVARGNLYLFFFSKASIIFCHFTLCLSNDTSSVLARYSFSTKKLK